MVNADKKRRPVVTGQTHDMGDLPNKTVEQRNRDRSKKSRQRRKTVMKRVREDEARARAKLGESFEAFSDLTQISDTSSSELFSPVRGDPKRLTSVEIVRRLEEVRANLLAITRKIARDWHAPLQVPTSAGNFELLVMNVIRFMTVTAGVLEKHHLNEEQWVKLEGSMAPEFLRLSVFTGEFIQSDLGPLEDALNETELEAVNLTSVDGFLRLWMESSFARLEVGHQLAAALCCTDVPPEVEVRAPWSAWSLIVPDGLFEHWGIVRLWCAGAEWLCSVTKDGRACPPCSGIIGDMARSLIRGSCLAISDPSEHRKPGAAPHKSAQRKSGAPNFEQARFLLSKPVSIDLRAHVAAASSGRAHGVPTVQFLVRGHWREQAHGPARALRDRKSVV